MAAHSNEMAAILRKGIEECGYSFLSDSMTNQLFPILPDAVINTLSLSLIHIFGPGVCVRLSIKEYLQAVVLPVHLHTAPVELPAGKLPLCLFGKLFDTGLYPADLRIVVG